MAKLVLRGDAPVTASKSPIEALKHFKPGDFICAVPDDHVFGREEKPPLFEIITVDMSVEELTLLCQPPSDVMDTGMMVRKFAPRSSFNLDWKVVGRNLTRAALMAALKPNALVDNPVVIGAPTNEIG